MTRLFLGGRVLTLRAHAPVQPLPLAIAAQGGRIAAIGEPRALLKAFPAARVTELEDRLVTPGLIDCHTHLVFGGNRAEELQRRLAGESYASIAHSGGGIHATVAATAALDDAGLAAASLARVDALLAEGITTLEVKSGYGLALEAELRLLRVARALATRRAVSVSTSYLAAHAVPPGYPGGAAAYTERLCSIDLPAVAASGLADAVDGYCESIAFSAEQIGRVFDCARALGLPVRLHADQLSNQQGAALAAQYGALSADHLEYTDAAGVTALARAGTVAVLLPGAYYFLRQDQPPPVAALRAAGVPMAIATDCNPGTSPLHSLLTAMNLAALLFGLSAAECLAGVTSAAARALGLLHDRGSIETGKWCDLAIWDVRQPEELVFTLGARPLYRRVWHGELA